MEGEESREARCRGEKTGDKHPKKKNQFEGGDPEGGTSLKKKSRQGKRRNQKRSAGRKSKMSAANFRGWASPIIDGASKRVQEGEIGKGSDNEKPPRKKSSKLDN